MEFFINSKKLISFTAVAMLSLSSAACVQTKPSQPLDAFTKSYQSDDSLSFANNVMHAAGLTGIHDAKVKGTTASMREGGASPIGLTLGTAVDAFSDPVGLGMGAAGAMNILFWLNNDKAPETYSRLIVWLPNKSNAEGESKSLRDTVNASILKYLEANPLKGYTTKTKEFYPPQYTGIRLIGDGCKEDAPMIDCYFAVGMDEDYLTAKSLKEFDGSIKAISPDFAGASDSVYIRAAIINHDTNLFGINRFKELDKLKMWQFVSANLPEYAYLYLAPMKYTYENSTDGIVNGHVPLMLNKGQINYFTVVEDK